MWRKDIHIDNRYREAVMTIPREDIGVRRRIYTWRDRILLWLMLSFMRTLK